MVDMLCTALYQKCYSLYSLSSFMLKLPIQLIISSY